MLIYQNDKVKIYKTNNLLLVLDGDRVDKDIHFEDESLLEEELLEIKERSILISKLV